MRHRDRATGLDLRLEFRHHRSVGGQHVPEPHRDQPHMRLALRLRHQVMVERLAIHFGEALGQAQHRDRLDRLVGRDHHHCGCTRRQRGVGDVDGTEDVGLDALAPVAFEDRHVLQGCGMEHDVGLEFPHQVHHPVTIADIGDSALDRRIGCARRQRLRHRVKRRFGMLDHQQPRGAEGRDAVANLRTDRAAAAGDDHRLALHQRFEPRVVDLLARPQQQVFDGDIGQPRHVAAFERRQAADEQAEPLGPHQDRFGVRLGFECRRGHDDPRNRLSASGIIAHHVLDIVEPAEHRHVADRLAAVRGRRRQHADRPKLLDCAALDRAQQHLRVGGAADQQRRRRSFGPGMAANARVAEIAIAETERAQREHLEKPVEHDGDAAEQHRRLAVRCRENEGIVEHDERYRQNTSHAHDVQRIGERNETPFRRRQVEDVADHDAEEDEEGQNAQQ